MQFNVTNVAQVQRSYPNWQMRGRIRKLDQDGNLIAGESAFGGEIVRISPRFQRNGSNYRIRPERPAYFFSMFCVENGVLPTPLTPEECESEAGLEILQALWDTYKQHLPKLESPFAACDQTEPSLKTGYSFCVPQVLVEQLGSVKTNSARPSFRPVVNCQPSNSSFIDRLRQRVEEMRGRNGAKQETPVSVKKKA